MEALIVGPETWERLRGVCGDLRVGPGGEVVRADALFGIPVFVTPDVPRKLVALKSLVPFVEFDVSDTWAVWAGMAVEVFREEIVSCKLPSPFEIEVDFKVPARDLVAEFKIAELNRG